MTGALSAEPSLPVIPVQTFGIPGRNPYQNVHQRTMIQNVRDNAMQTMVGMKEVFFATLKKAHGTEEQVVQLESAIAEKQAQVQGMENALARTADVKGEIRLEPYSEVHVDVAQVDGIFVCGRHTDGYH